MTQSNTLSSTRNTATAAPATASAGSTIEAGPVEAWEKPGAHRFGFTIPIHSVIIDGRRWFLAPDLVKVLGFNKPATHYTGDLAAGMRRVLLKAECPEVFQQLNGATSCTIVSPEGAWLMADRIRRHAKNPKRFHAWLAERCQDLDTSPQALGHCFC